MAAPTTVRRQTSRKQAGPTAAKKAAPRKKAAPLQAIPRDEPMGRFAQLLTEIEPDEPYQVTADLFIQPPSKGRMELIITAQSAYIIARGQLEAMMSPLTDAAGKPLKDDDDQLIFPKVSEAQLGELEKLVNKAAENYDRALFGDSYDEVMRLSLGWTGKVWNAFYEDVQDKFLPVPADGKCPTCGNIVNREAAGEAPASATSSSTTGTT